MGVVVLFGKFKIVDFFGQKIAIFHKNPVLKVLTDNFLLVLTGNFLKSIPKCLVFLVLVSSGILQSVYVLLRQDLFHCMLVLPITSP